MRGMGVRHGAKEGRELFPVPVVLVHPAGDRLPVVRSVVDTLPCPDAVPLALLSLHLHHVASRGVEWSPITATYNLEISRKIKQMSF